MTQVKKKNIGKIFWKILLVTIELHGMACVTMSYILALTGHDQTVELVSQTVVTEILAPFVAGMITKTVENIFEKNILSCSKPIDMIEQFEFEKEGENHE